MLRQSRKLEHIKYSLVLEDGPGDTGFHDITLIHNCLSNISMDSIDMSTAVAGIVLKHPIVINAITGGAQDVKEVNAYLAEFAKKTHSAMAVGSQYAAIEDPSVADTFSIVREVNPDGIIFANLGAHATVNDAKNAIKMINADALQLHLNVAQEVFMSEGDRDFTGYLDNIAEIINSVDVPVIVKEVGCGIAREQAGLLLDRGVRCIDIGGMGGTNFMAIEAARINQILPEETLTWGIPTVISAIEVKDILPQGTDMIVSGGVRTSLDIIKSLSLGASAVAIAGEIIKILRKQGIDYAVAWFDDLLAEMQRYMLMLGKQNISQLQNTPLIISGNTKCWVEQRDIDIKKFAVRRIK